MTFVSTCATAALLLVTPLAFGSTITVKSPDGKVQADLSDDSGLLTYRVHVDGKPILSPSRLGVRTDGVEFGEQVTLGKPKHHSVHESYPFFGGHSMATNRANQAAIPATSHGQSYTVDLHVANDGVGVRLRLPAKPGRKMEADRSSWKLAGDPTIWAQKLEHAYENPYHASTLRQLGGESLGLPLTADIGGTYATITEAALKDYGDLGVKVGADGVLEGDLYADPEGWTTDAEVVQPWRVTIVARDWNTLVNTTLVQDLNPPPDPALAKADWIKPGRSAWQWMAVGSPRLEDQHQWVDWTSQLDFEYYLIDDGWIRWNDPWKALAEITAYAKTRNVKIWIWVHSREIKDAEARKAYLRKVVDTGIVGVKVDFPQACNRWWSNWYIDTARDAAESHLLLDIHGAVKPTGTERTWPNVLTREGVRGHEYHITRYKRRLEPDHDVILPFTRYIVGPGDYTPTVFDPTELQGNTWAHELAQAVIFTSPYLCFSGNPKDYLSNPARDVLTRIPAVWDETRVLPGSAPGKAVIFARRSGNQWFVAGMNGAEATTFDLPHDFLGKGSWQATELFDADGKLDGWTRKTSWWERSDHQKISLAPRGGFVIYLHK